MNLGYICTNYNNSHFTKDAVKSLVASAGSNHDLRIIVVDNESTTEQRDCLKKLADEYACVDLLLNQTNVGYFPGLNCGINRMREKFPDVNYIVIGNNDLIFPIDFCSKVEAQLHLLEEYPVVSPDIITLDGEHQNPHVIKEISVIREIVYDLYYFNYALAQLILWVAKISLKLTDRHDERQYQTAQTIYQGHGSCYLIGPKFFKYFEEFWAPTFLMGEEFFLSKQLSDQGMQTFYTPEINLTHCCHGALNAMPSRKLWQIAREAHKTYRKYVKVFK